MGKRFASEQLMIPVYINEKIVLDMLAIAEDGFSTVSQVNYTEHRESDTKQNIGADASTSATILSKLLKIDLKGEVSHEGKSGNDENVVKEKVHTNVSLLSKFRTLLKDESLLKTDFDVSKMKIGDFIEVEGELQKNPLINCIEIFTDMFRMADIFADEPQLGGKTQAKAKKTENNKVFNQMKAFLGELKHSGTVDFVLDDEKGTVVLSAQEQYLSNDNVSEIIGGRFKVLGKVIAICRSDAESVDLLRKTSLAIVSETMLTEMLAGFKDDDMKQFHLPELKTKIAGPAVIVIPIAIYA